MNPISRRQFLIGGAALLGGIAVTRARAQTPAGQRKSDPLPDTTIIGAPRDRLDALDNDPTIIGVERRLRCTCGCTQDIYTCRTTDFTCTFSPALHREIKGMYTAGKTPQEIIDSLVGREGPQMLLAPPAEGFTLAGYLLPGLSVIVAVLLLASYLVKKRQGPVALAGVRGPVATPPAAPADSADLERLRRALDEVES